ncbi:MAG: hypothetical protein ACOH5I_26345 [Oligoflexus sp.]
MRKILPLLICLYGAHSCDSKGGKNSAPKDPPVITPTPKPKPNPEPDPDPKPEDEVLRLYEPDFSPLTARMVELKKSDVPIVDDFFRYQQGIAVNWGESRTSDHIPSTYISLWNPNDIKYVDETKGEVKGIEKLEIARKNMLSICPNLALPEFNAPIEIHWKADESTKSGGSYKAVDIFLSEDLNLNPVYNGGLFPWLNQTIWINGKNLLWDYPHQTTGELEKPWGIDQTFVHEWGHHLAYAIDLNLGRSSYQTWQFTESFAEAVRYTCFGSSLDKPEILESEYRELRRELGGEHKQLRNPTTLPVQGSKYSLRSMEKCIAHEKYHGKFDPNDFLSAIIEAYKRVEGRKLDPNPYPIYFDFNGGFAQAPWAGGAFGENMRIAENQPLLVTRAEFLERFLEVYDCGLANEFIEADIEGMKKFEW